MTTALDVFDKWHRLSYEKRLLIAARFHLKRSGIVAVVNTGNGKSHVQNDGYTIEDITSVFTPAFVEAAVPPGDYLIDRFFDYAYTGNVRGAEEITGGAVSEASSGDNGNEGVSQSDVRTAHGQDNPASGAGTPSNDGNAGVLQTELDKGQDSGIARDGLRSSVQVVVKPPEISKEERMMNAKQHTPTPKVRTARGEAQSLRAKAIWAARKAKQNGTSA